MSDWIGLARRYKRQPTDLPALLAGWQEEVARLDAAADLAGLAAAEALDRALNGDQSAMGEYTERLGMIDAAYQSHLSAWYGLETRWMDQEFWRRRVKMALT